MSNRLAIAENEHFDRKSLRTVTGTTSDFVELACDCVAFANGSGGTLLIGIEDDSAHPPADQRVEPTLLERLRKRIGELTVNVQALPELRRDENGGEYVVLTVPRSIGVASPWLVTTCCASRTSGPRLHGRR
jgi:ATP-dependent DNA helicase RecG